jgi:hypothetical protein
VLAAYSPAYGDLQKPQPKGIISLRSFNLNIDVLKELLFLTNRGAVMHDGKDFWSSEAYEVRDGHQGTSSSNS